jgi:hypothetical protein
MKRGNRGNYKPWFRGGGGRGMGGKSRPLMSKAGNKDDDENGNPNRVKAEDAVFMIMPEPGCPYAEWKLYFPKQSK